MSPATFSLSTKPHTMTHRISLQRLGTGHDNYRKVYIIWLYFINPHKMSRQASLLSSNKENWGPDRACKLSLLQINSGSHWTPGGLALLCHNTCYTLMKEDQMKNVRKRLAHSVLSARLFPFCFWAMISPSPSRNTALYFCIRGGMLWVFKAWGFSNAMDVYFELHCHFTDILKELPQLNAFLLSTLQFPVVTRNTNALLRVDSCHEFRVLVYSKNSSRQGSVHWRTPVI